MSRTEETKYERVAGGVAGGADRDLGEDDAAVLVQEALAVAKLVDLARPDESVDLLGDADVVGVGEVTSSHCPSKFLLAATAHPAEGVVDRQEETVADR